MNRQSIVNPTSIRPLGKRRAARNTAGISPKCLLLMVSLCVSSGIMSPGCRTASSLGLPVAAGSHNLLPEVAELRQASGHPNDVPTEMAKSVLPPHRVEAGDTLLIEPNDFNSPVRLPGDQTVSRDGSIDLGQYGKIQVAGMTAEEIRGAVQQAVFKKESEKRAARIALASHRDDDSEVDPDLGVSVRLISQESALIYVMGEVNAPGSYPLNGHETVLDALIAAGGLSDRANDHRIVLTRPQPSGEPRVILPVCYHQVLQLGDVATNYQLMPGDRIYVPSLSLMEDLRQSLPWGKGRSCPQCRRYGTK